MTFATGYYRPITEGEIGFDRLYTYQYFDDNGKLCITSVDQRKLVESVNCITPTDFVMSGMVTDREFVYGDVTSGFDLAYALSAVNSAGPLAKSRQAAAELATQAPQDDVDGNKTPSAVADKPQKE